MSKLIRSIKIFSLFFYSAFFICWKINAQIKINEIGIEQNPQIIELINTSSESANISSWYLDDSGGSTYYSIPINTYLYPLSCLVFTYDFNLNKSSPDMVRLFDSTAQPVSSSAKLIDSYSYKTSPGINNGYSRTPDGAENWTISTSSFGSWNSTHENCLMLPSVTPLITNILYPSPTINPTPTQEILPTTGLIYSNIFISEVMVYPDENQNEWVELYNDNDFSVNLTDWYIDDLENGGTIPKKFSLFIDKKQYASVNLSSSLFNNDGDHVRLLDINKSEKDSFEYEKSIQGKTYGRIDLQSDSFCKQEPSKNIANTICITENSSSLMSTTNIVQEKVIITLNPTIPQKKIKSYITRIPRFESITENNLQNNVLGTKIQHTTSQLSKDTFPESPFYISFSYSLLTIFFTFIKMKNAFFI